MTTPDELRRPASNLRLALADACIRAGLLDLLLAAEEAIVAGQTYPFCREMAANLRKLIAEKRS